MRLYKPFLKLADLRKFQAKFPNWPPPGASPPIVLEPYGKNIFVYNSRPDVELRGDPRAVPWDDTKPEWMIEENKLSLLSESQDPNDYLLATNMKHLDLTEEDCNKVENQVETVVCITDYRKRPLTWLLAEDFKQLHDNMPQLLQWFDEFDKVTEEYNRTADADDAEKRQDVELGLDKTRTYRRGRWMKPRHDKGGRGARSGIIRQKRVI